MTLASSSPPPLYGICPDASLPLRKPDFKMSANVGLAIQCVGIVLMALLSLSMHGSINSPSLKCWTRAWIALALALVSLFAGFHLPPEQKLFYSLYFFVE